VGLSDTFREREEMSASTDAYPPLDTGPEGHDERWSDDGEEWQGHNERGEFMRVEEGERGRHGSRGPGMGEDEEDLGGEAEVSMVELR
jgi:hypothetical protein